MQVVASDCFAPLDNLSCKCPTMAVGRCQDGWFKIYP